MEKWSKMAIFEICDKIKGIKGEITTWYAKILKQVYCSRFLTWCEKIGSLLSELILRKNQQN